MQHFINSPLEKEVQYKLAIQIANKAHLDATTAIDNWFLKETKPANI